MAEDESRDSMGEWEQMMAEQRATTVSFPYQLAVVVAFLATLAHWLSPPISLVFAVLAVLAGLYWLLVTIDIGAYPNDPRTLAVALGPHLFFAQFAILLIWLVGYWILDSFLFALIASVASFVAAYAITWIIVHVVWVLGVR